MATDDAMAVRPEHLRELLDSAEADPVLVLSEGRFEVVAGEGRSNSGLEVVTRDDFLHSAGQTEFTDEELEQRAAALTAVVGNLGG